MIRPIVVIKVGGSLLDWPELAEQLIAYIESQRESRLVLVVGGGRFADALRDLDVLHRLGEESSHELALRVLDLTAHLLARLLPGTLVVEDLSKLDDAWSANQVPILAPRRFLDEDDKRPNPLPHTWATTTDSIAARLAMRLQADQLVLLKSRDVPQAIDLSEASRLGLVDPEFPRASSSLPIVSIENLRRVSPADSSERGRRPS